MKQYSIHEISHTLGITKHTLRYYDKIGLVCPLRGENKYRYYTEQDMLNLQYIEVMKYAGFSLSEIRQILSNKQEGNESGFAHTVALLADKKLELERKIALYRAIVKLVKEAENAMHAKETPTDVAKMNALITTLFKELRSDLT